MPFACDAARSDRTLWKELACDRATSLSALGDGVEDDYLPGLGTLKGWGLEYELGGRVVHGGLLSGYWSEPTAVTIWGPLLVSGGHLAIETLLPMLTLPSGLLSTLDEVLSVSAPGLPGYEVALGGGEPVFQSTSSSAAATVAEIVRHLTLASSEVRAIVTRPGSRLETTVVDGVAEMWRPVGASIPPAARWHALGDYAQGPP